MLLRFVGRYARIFSVSIALTVAALGPTAAQGITNVPTPRIKPAAPSSSQFLDKSDAREFRLGLASADRRIWSDVDRRIAALKDPIAKDVLRWRKAADDGSASFEDLTRVIQYQPDWPRMVRIRSKAEKMLFDDTPLSAADTVGWFAGMEPVSGEGRAALAVAHYKLGNKTSGDQWLKLAWRESKLTRDRQRYLFSRYKDRLSKDDHAARADYLIWLGKSYFSSAEALLPHMSRADSNLMNARIRVGANRSGMDAAIKRLTPAQAKDTGLLFERARWRRTRKSKDYALPVYQQIKAPASTESGRKRMWFELKLMAYWQLESGKYNTAYNLVQNHGYTRGTQFAEAEFFSGWLALTQMNNPQRALRHFTTLRDNVSTPVSRSRGAYWQGRAAQAANDVNAQAYYADAAQHINTFYGQLAASELAGSGATITLPPEDDGQFQSAEFEARPIIRGLRLVGETGNERIFRQMAFHLDDELESPQELSLLASLSRDYRFYSPGVRAAKQAGRFNTILTESSYPTPNVITDLGSEFDLPFVLAIARQESEFDTSAVSSAKAYGMMQMIDGTARYTARKHRLKYRKSWLTSDQDYAAKLGAHHLHDLLKTYDGSYIMAAAAYNAGASRVNKWNRVYGDPRKGEITPIDWAENIPFSETRNYVQRVLENINVYRARLDGNQAPLLIEQDLSVGSSFR